jgi:hypothetical protein
MNLLRVTRMLILLTLGALPSLASAAPDRVYGAPPRVTDLTDEQRELVRLAESLAVPLSEERIMYHYGKPEPCEKLAEGGSYTGEVYNKYSRISEKGSAVAGHGIYIAGNPSSSASYFKGGAVEAVLAPGTPLIDLTDQNTRDAMSQLGLGDADIKNLPINAVVKYNTSYDWYVIKGPMGVRFRTMNFGRLSDLEFTQFLEEASWRSKPGADTGIGAQIVQRIESSGSARGHLASLWIRGSGRQLDFGRMGQLSQEAQWDGLESMRREGLLEEALEGLRWSYAAKLEGSGLRSLGLYIDALPEDREKWLGRFLDVAYNPVIHLAALPERARAEGFEYLRQSGTLDETLRRLSVRLDEPDSADVYRSLKAYLNSPGEGKIKFISDHVFSGNHDGIQRLVEFSVPVQDDVVRYSLRAKPGHQVFRLLTAGYGVTPEQIRRLDEIKASLRDEILKRTAGQGRFPKELIPELFSLSTLDGGKWVNDWELKRWVESMAPAERLELSQLARQWLTSFEGGGSASEFARVTEFTPVGRVISALEAAEAGGRRPAHVPPTVGLANRYRGILASRFKESRPSLPVLHSGPVAQYCSAKLASTLEGLRMIGPPILLGMVPAATLIYLSVSQKLEAREGLKSLCGREGGLFLPPSGDTPGGCRCPVGSGGRELQFTWDTLSQRDEQAALCGGAGP